MTAVFTNDQSHIHSPLIARQKYLFCTKLQTPMKTVYLNHMFAWLLPG